MRRVLVALLGRRQGESEVHASWFRRWGKAVAAASFFLSLIVPLAVFAGPTEDPQAKIESPALDLATQGESTFWVILRDKADLRPAYTMRDRDARGRFVFDQLRATADASQASLRGWLQARGVVHRPFWIVNAIQVTADKTTLQAIAARPEVERIVADGAYHIPAPIPGKEQPRVQTVEWSIDRIRAPEVWSDYGVRGEDIVVANIDTGVEYTHSALVNQYRGNLGGGVFDHNYSWFDPSNVCGFPSLAPCDNVGHGTHTMGTMVGDDGDPGPNQIGVAPHARWIAAKGCESDSCSFGALMASGQWILAPTDLNGQNPRPDLRPHIVNNSWGGSNDPFYKGIVQAWVASGIFPAFSNGNSGPSCSTAGSPGDYVESYAAGAFDISNFIAFFSSRGPSAFGGEIKPNIAAPGVDVRSSVPGNSYAAYSGTSMASPHVAGTVALMWSADPSLVGDITATRALLDQTAIDTEDLSCGGTPQDNNVWGEGRLDARAAVPPPGPTGFLQGTVTDTFASPIPGATVRAVGPVTRTTATDPAGYYHFVLPVGTYDATASAFGFLPKTKTGIVVVDGQTTIRNFALTAAPLHPVSGFVRDGSGEPVPNATVTILNTPIPPATTDATGFYSFPSVPVGTYDVRAEAGRCNDPQTQQLVVSGPITLNFVLPLRTDSFGYSCQVVPFSFIDANTVLPLSGDDSVTQVSLPFPVTFYGQTYNTAFVATNGFLNFLGSSTRYSNGSIPDPSEPNAAIYPFWDDLDVDGAASVRTELLGTAPNRQFVIEWRNVTFYGSSDERVRFEVVLFENGRILTQYTDIDANGREQGDSATLGIENETGTVALQYSFNEPAVSNNLAVLYSVPPSGFVEGAVTDANDGLAVAGGTARALLDGTPVRVATTDANGFYRMQLPLGTYTIEVSANNYSTGSASVTLDVEGEVQVRNFVLSTARVEVSPTSFEFILPVNKTQTKTLSLQNTGSRDLNWHIGESGGSGVSINSTFGLPRNPTYDPNSRTTEGLYLGGTPSGWSPTAPGDVIRSWVPAGLNHPWGVGFSGNVWLSDSRGGGGGTCGDTDECRDVEFDVFGAATGRNWPAPWASAWNADMAYDAGRGLICEVNVGGDNGIYCWNPNTGEVVASITGAFPWTSVSQRGLAYRLDDDTFYVGGWNEAVLYHIQGLSGSTPGAVISQCSPPDGNISGLAWHPTANIVWEATNSPSDTIYELNPDTCAVLATLPHPNPSYNGAGLEMDEAGNLWMVSQAARTVYLVESGMPLDVPWLSENPSSGTLPVGGTKQIKITVNTTGLTPGVHNATMFIQSDSGRQPSIQVPVSLLVTAPDLIETAVGNPPASQNRGTSFRVTDTVKNEGGQLAGPSYTLYYLSRDSVRSSDDRPLTGFRAVRGLAAGATSTGTVTVQIPLYTTLGTYFLLACADDTLVVTEEDEENNCLASASTILVTAPDLTVTAVSNPPASVARGGSFNVTDTTANVGTGPAGASTTRYYLSLDKKKGATDVLLTGSRPVPALLAGASSTGTVGVTVLVTTPLGTYYLLACADDLKVVKESNEGNNCQASATRVQVTAP